MNTINLQSNGATVGFGSGNCGFLGTLSTMSVTWDPGSVRLLNIPMSINASRQGSLSLSFLATGPSTAAIHFLNQGSFFSSVTISSYNTAITGGNSMSFKGCRKHSAAIEQRNIGGAFVIEGTIKLTFQDYSTQAQETDIQPLQNGRGAIGNKWDF